MAGRSRRRGPGTSRPASAAQAGFLRSVSARVELAVAGIAGLGLVARVTVQWSTAHDALVVRCLILEDGAPSEAQRRVATFAGGYLACALLDLGPQLQWPGAGQHLVIPLPPDLHLGPHSVRLEGTGRSKAPITHREDLPQ